MTTVDPDCPPRTSVLASAPVTDGATLTFETVAAIDPAFAATRLRPIEDVLLRVIDGTVRLTVNGEARVLETGAEAIVPAGTPHTITGVGAAARYVMGMRARLYSIRAPLRAPAGGQAPAVGGAAVSAATSECHPSRRRSSDQPRSRRACT